MDGLERGTLLNGGPNDYRLVREVGRGGMGVVYEAVHVATGRRRAVKLLSVAASGRADALERMMREARAASLLKSAHATRIHSCGITCGQTPYIVMELLEGVDLATYLAKAGGRLPVDDAIGIVLQACEAIAEAHSLGMVHRDLKPANIFVTCTAAGTPHVKLLDFGLAKLAPTEISTRTRSGLVFGTPQYMPPEQLKSSTDVDARSDVWALGVILCELVYGSLPFGGNNVSQVIASILSAAPELPSRRDAPNELRRIVLRCLAKKSRGRYRDAHALRDDLARVPVGTSNLHDFSVVTPRPWSFERPTRRCPVTSREDWSRLEWIAAVLACVMTLTAGVLTSAATRRRPPIREVVAAEPPLAPIETPARDSPLHPDAGR